MPAISGYLQQPIGTDEVDEDAAQDEPAVSEYQVVPGPGPNLTLLACRDTIGAGILENNAHNLERWLKQTEQVKEGVYMPNYYTQGSINDDQVTELVEFLQSLKPADGCPDDGLPVGSQIDPAQLEAIDP
jgi:hypothetical protein